MWIRAFPGPSAAADEGPGAPGNVGPILFKHDTILGETVRSADDLKRDGYEIFVPVNFEP
jgi:hypothetical protein